MSYKYVPKEVRIKLTRKRIFLVLTIIAFIFSLYLALTYLIQLYESSKPLKRITYMGVPMEFREDIRLAKNIEVYPDESFIKSIFWGRELKEITIGVLNYTNETNLIGVEAVEITFKLSSFYTLMNMKVSIKGKEIGSIEEIRGNSTHPAIVIVPPSIANETAVRLEDYKLIISGKSIKELDLATIKFILLVLGI